MDAAAPSAKRDKPLIPPNYVSLRHLQELRLKEKEEQRQREEEAAATRVKEAAAAVAAEAAEMKASSDTSFGYKERPRGGQRFVVVAHRPPPQRGEGTAVRKDGATGGCRGKKGPDGNAANVPQGGGGKAENKGKVKVPAGTTGDPAEPDKPATASSHGGKPEEKRKLEASGDQSTASGTSDAPGEPAEASIASSRGRGRSVYKHKGKKGPHGRSTETATTSATGEAADSSPPRGVNSENKGKKKPSECRRADTAPSSDSPDGKRAQSRTAAEGSSNRRSGGGQGMTWEAKSEGRGEKQSVVEVRAQPRPAAEGSSNRRSGIGDGTTWEAKSEVLGEKQPVVEVRAQTRPAAKGSSNRRSGGGQGTTREAKSEGLREKQPVVEVRATAQQKLWDVRSLARQQPGGGHGNGATGQHDRVWMPKVAAVQASANVEKIS